MAASPIQAIPEYWTELSTTNSQRTKCAEDVEELKRTCEKDCGKTHIMECESCYGKVLDRMRSRYIDGTQTEWFSQRGAFLQELDDLFADTKKHGRGLAAIEASIESEKEAWYRWVLRRYPEFLEASNHSIPQEELRGMLDDPDRSRDELVAMMWQGVGKPNNWSAKVDALIEKVTAAGDNTEELKQIYQSEFFLDNKTGEPLEHAKGFLQEYQNNGPMTLGDIVAKIAVILQNNRSTQPQRDNHLRHLDELRRARTAVEQNKMRSKGLTNSGTGFKDELYNLPSCFNCQEAVYIDDVISCSLCQVALQIGSKGELTVYCSEKCYNIGQFNHVEKSHPCHAGESCLLLQDEDIDMDGGSKGPFLCKVCVDGKKITLFCTEKCGIERISHHRMASHGVGTADAAAAKGTITTLSATLQSVMERENSGLKFSTLD